ncbi:OmpA family protein [Flagellimonas meridianipacifica]|uniref:Outer membrane protein OmpA-like peptidoglycan-associated protein n=1 Tax=Flagellimonas meridianipacifica TaxID=1080225 RepID=A0A2T0MCV7_9FLAO|nr:OmpA family protein [Allomuricauda pacifica]PRX55310.1 outer membrane protein OmpA-like peptidoglycan-associated protein [Allomuricauda pacifica]
MKTFKVTAICLLCIPSIFFGQELQLTKKDTIVKSSWMVSLGMNVVDDSGDEFGNLLDIRDGWNAVPFPSRISIGRYFQNGLGLEAIGTYNQYREGKIVDNVVNTEDIDYFGIDFRISYDLNQIIGETGFFDPYVGIGAGYTDANNQGRGTYNGVVGFRTWLSDRVGLDFNSTGKWAMSTENATNHIQHAIGVVYQFDIEKGLSPKGEEKLALLKEMEAEQKRVQDSIAEKERADEEARLLAERLKREQEAAKLAAAEKAEQEVAEKRRADIENEIKALGNVYFALNSSYLTPKDKTTLDKLALIMDKYPKLRIEVSAHTDSRGTDKYNQWLSERRVKRTVEYLLNKKVDASRLKSAAYGEERLVNECKDKVPCSEAKHSENRRSVFAIVEI